MSWFTDLAGKAEDFLNKMDQGAATALTKSQTRTSSFSSSYGEESTIKPEYNSEGYKTNAAVTHPTYAPSDNAPSYISAAAGNIKRSNATLLAGSANMTSPSPGSGSSAASSAKISSSFVRPKKEQDVDDDMLFDFLNSSDPPVSNRRDSRRELVKVAVPVTEGQNPTPPPSSTPHTIPSAPSTPPSTRGVSRASSMSSLSAHSVKTSEENSAKEQSQGMKNKSLYAVMQSSYKSLETGQFKLHLVHVERLHFQTAYYGLSDSCAKHVEQYFKASLDRMSELFLSIRIYMCFSLHH